MDLRRIGRLSLVRINRRVYQLRRILGVKRTLGEIFIRQWGIIEVIDKIPPGIALGAAAVLCAVSFRVITGGEIVVSTSFCFRIEVDSKVNPFPLWLYCWVRVLAIFVRHIVVFQRLIDSQVALDNSVLILIGSTGVVLIFCWLLQLQSVGFRRVQIIRINSPSVGFIGAGENLIGVLDLIDLPPHFLVLKHITGTWHQFLEIVVSYLDFRNNKAAVGVRGGCCY